MGAIEYRETCFSRHFFCIDLFEQDLSSSPERGLADRFRAASDVPFPAFPDDIAAFNEACQPEEVPQNGTHKRKETAEWMLPFAALSRVA